MPTPPFFILDRHDDDIGVFPSVTEAEADMETPDVQNHEYDLFDSLGHRAVLAAEGLDVKVVDWTSEVFPGLLKSRLLKWLASVNETVPQETPLDELVPIAERRFKKWERDNRWLRWRPKRRRT